MKKKLAWAVLTVCLAGAGMTAARAAILDTVRTYDGACSELGGFPGLLQVAGLMPKGTCKVTEQKRCSETFCDASGKKGKCVYVKKPKAEPFCFCEPIRTSH